MVRIRLRPPHWAAVPLMYMVGVMLILGAVPALGANLPCCPVGDPSIDTIRSYQVMTLQGDDPTTAAQEPKN